MIKKDRDLMDHLNEPDPKKIVQQKYIKNSIDGADVIYRTLDRFIDIEIFWSSLDKKYAIFFWLNDMVIIQKYFVDFENVEKTIDKFIMIMEKALIEAGEG